MSLREKTAIEIAKVYIKSELKEFENETWKNLEGNHWQIYGPVYSIGIFFNELGKLDTCCGIYDYSTFKEKYKNKLKIILKNVVEIITGANRVDNMEPKDIIARMILIENELAKKVGIEEVYEAIKQSKLE